MTEFLFKITDYCDRFLDFVKVVISHTSDTITIYMMGNDYIPEHIRWFKRYLNYIFFNYDIHIRCDVRSFTSFREKYIIRNRQPAPAQQVKELRDHVKEQRRQEAIRISKIHLERCQQLLSPDFVDVFLNMITT